MTYATLAHLTDRFGNTLLKQLTDRASPPIGAIDTDVVDRALADTDAIIDGHLAARYVLPMASTPVMLIDLAAVISIYKLHSRSVPEKIKDDYRDAMVILSKISSGAIRLEIQGIEPASSDASGVQTTDRERPMTAQNLKGYI